MTPSVKIALTPPPVRNVEHHGTRVACRLDERAQMGQQVDGLGDCFGLGPELAPVSKRRQRLSSLATTPEEQQTFAGAAVQAKAVFEAAQQQVAQAEINLRRTQVRSPVNGYVTNLMMRRRLCP